MATSTTIFIHGRKATLKFQESFTKKMPLYFFTISKRPLYFVFSLKHPLTNGLTVQKVTRPCISLTDLPLRKTQMTYAIKDKFAP